MRMLNCGSVGLVVLMNCGSSVVVNRIVFGLLFVIRKLLWNSIVCDVDVLCDMVLMLVVGVLFMWVCYVFMLR